MSRATYRIRRADGPVVDVHLTVAQIAKQFPGAVITHRIQFDDAGHGVPHPYTGEQPAVSPDTEQESEPESPHTGTETPPESGKKAALRDETGESGTEPHTGLEPSPEAENKGRRK